MFKLKTLTTKYLRQMRAREIPVKCAQCGREFHRGDRLWHRRASSRQLNRIKFFCVDHLYSEPARELRDFVKEAVG